MQELDGYVKHIVYHNDKNGYTVLSAETGEDEQILVGFFQTIDEGEHLVAKGEFVDHPTYGVQFKVESYEIKEPGDVESIRRYLASGAIKGIGAALAERIVKKFGADTLRIMEEEPERLAQIKGISERKACEIGMIAESKKDIRNAMLFLQKYSIPNGLALKIYEKYGNSMYAILQTNPYRLSEDIEGVGFKTADKIAARIGIHVDSDYRIRSGLLYALLEAGGEGHLYLPKSLLVRKTEELLELEGQEEMIGIQMENLIMERKLIAKPYLQENGREELALYAAAAYQCEAGCAALLRELNRKLITEKAEEERIRSEILKRGRQKKEILDDLQVEAVVKSACNGVMILTGGPGTGKTTTINTMLRYFSSEGMNICLAAPTGRAAKRMTEATGYEARTIHRLLEVNGGAEEGRHFFERNEDNPIEADVIIIDEMSMVDIYLFFSLLKAVPVGTRLIMAGDRDQLPSVGPGKVLKDMIESECFPVVKLQKIFRQAAESDIVMNAHRIRKGEPIVMDNKSRDFFFLPRNDVNVIYKHIVQLITDKLPRYVGVSPFEIQVLTPTRRGPLGVETLNGILQQFLNPEERNKRECKNGETLFREGDKVMQIRNNYKLEWEILSRYHIPIDKGVGVFNGDTGIIREINTYAETVTVEYDEHKRVTYPYSGLDELELAYAVTVHKSQGSEYPAVIMPLLGVPKMLTYRNLFYTAVTRAKNCVTLLGSKETIGQMIENGREQERYSGLKSRILECYVLPAREV
ncbi:MAG: ATP-dependent RecD-like DNA helicase [Lachnospiraceae bacterium]|jgi:exodeoxyribonuclease V alpha subunit|nr:ATP-dependent RecD-like DNA helicase [Lachnospiraceae bacterium]